MIVFAGREGREAKYDVGEPEPDEEEEKFMNDGSGARDREVVETCRMRFRVLVVAMLRRGRGW